MNSAGTQMHSTEYQNPLFIARVYHTSKDLYLGSWREVFFTIWRGDTTVGGVDLIERYAKLFAFDKPKGIGLLTVVEERCPMPPSDASARLAKFMEAATYVKASGLVFEGGGLRGHAVRAMVAFMASLRPHKFPHKVFSTPKEAETWLVPQLPQAGLDYHPNNIVSALENLRCWR